MDYGISVCSSIGGNTGGMETVFEKQLHGKVSEPPGGRAGKHTPLISGLSGLKSALEEKLILF